MFESISKYKALLLWAYHVLVTLPSLSWATKPIERLDHSSLSSMFLQASIQKGATIRKTGNTMS